ncbi:hypothetical protein HMPREF3016_04215 [Rothia sp. HMSC065D02]|nr:hypothetical protein HMPREF3016_04215 [Rothia sp. HMSC065D02]
MKIYHQIPFHLIMSMDLIFGDSVSHSILLKLCAYMLVIQYQKEHLRTCKMIYILGLLRLQKKCIKLVGSV